jgi:hypothetical protein
LGRPEGQPAPFFSVLHQSADPLIRLDLLLTGQHEIDGFVPGFDLDGLQNSLRIDALVEADKEDGLKWLGFIVGIRIDDFWRRGGEGKFDRGG